MTNHIMKKLTLFIFLLTLAVKPVGVFAKNDYPYQALASFIYDFQTLVKDQKGRLCVYGYDQVVVAIEAKNEDVIFLKNEDQLSVSLSQHLCKVLYVAKSKDNNLSSVITIANKAQIVSMSIEDDFVERGGMIAVQMGRRSFELNINHKNIEKFKTKFDPIVPSFVVN